VAERNGHKLANVSMVLPIVALVVIVQATLVARVRFLGVTPDLLLAVVVAWSLLSGIQSGILWAFFGGLIFDAVTGIPLGTSSLALMTICFLTSLGETNLFHGSVFLPIAVIVLATPIHGWIILVTQQLRHLQVDWPGVTLRILLPETLLNVIVVVLVYPALRWLARQAGVERMDW
jgi:rod shape-determining protein MreD